MWVRFVSLAISARPDLAGKDAKGTEDQDFLALHEQPKADFPASCHLGRYSRVLQLRNA